MSEPFLGSTCSSNKAIACWQWLNFLEARCPLGKTVLHINMDESHIPLFWPSKLGFFQLPPCCTRKRFLRQEQQATLAKRRAGFTLMAAVADDPAVQSVLPQVILANRHTLSRADWEAMGGHLRADNIFVLRRKSSWATTSTIVEFVRLLAKVLEPLAQQRHVILTLDTAPAHLGERVARACSRANMFLHYVPAHMTAWLQPLDAYVFAPLKRFLRKAYHAQQLSCPTGHVTIAQSIDMLCSGIHGAVSPANKNSSANDCASTCTGTRNPHP